MKMTRKEALKIVWDKVVAGHIKEATDIAYEYDIVLTFDDDYIAVEDDVYYFEKE